MKTLTTTVKKTIVTPSGNWNTAKDWFPEININQETGEIQVETHDSTGYQSKACISTILNDFKYSGDKSQLLITGEVDCRNWNNAKCSGTQKFVYAVFEGDSGHIYIHRAPATKGWTNCNPDLIRKRLVKLGIGAITGVIQQGDFLLKPANGNSLAIDRFKHEWTSSSHHNFSEPLLSEFVPGIGRYILIPEGKSVELHHHAVDGIQHPMQTVSSGQWIIGSTASQLSHNNRMD